MTASVSSVSAAAVSGWNSEKSRDLPENSFTDRSELSSSRAPSCCVREARQSSTLCATSTPSSRRPLPACSTPRPFCALPSQVACSTTPPTTPINTRPTRPRMKYVPAPNPTRHAPSVSLLAVAKNWRVRSVSAFTSSAAASCASLRASGAFAPEASPASRGVSTLESRGLVGG
jgi:hypothetical protein